MTLQPTREDKFTFGLWTVGWQARDLFGEATRPVLAAVEAVHKLTELGAYGITFHDDDLIPPGSSRASGNGSSTSSGRRWTRPAWWCRWPPRTCSATRCSRTAASPATTGRVRRYALRKVMRNMDLAAELGAKIYVFWGGREGSEVDFAKDVRAALDRYREGMDLLAQYFDRQGLRHAVRHRAQAQRAPRRHPAADHRPRAGVHPPARARRHGRHQPRDRPRADGEPQLHPRHRAGAVGRQAVPHRPQRAEGPRYDQDLVFGYGDLLQAFSTVDLLENGAPGGGPTYDGDRHFDYKPLRTEDIDGVWESARANMELYLTLREQARAFRADPEVQKALEAARVAELGQPTLERGRVATTSCSPTAARSRTSTSTAPGPRATASPHAAARDRAPARRPLIL